MKYLQYQANQTAATHIHLEIERKESKKKSAVPFEMKIKS